MPFSVNTKYTTELIGMLQGHFSVVHGPLQVNSGIAIVIPVQDIVDLLMKDELLLDREKASDRLRATRSFAQSDSSQ